MAELFHTYLFRSPVYKSKITAYYRFSTGRELLDSGPNGYTLTQTGTPTYATGKFGNAITTSDGNILYHNSTTVADLTTGAITIGIWFKTIDTSPTANYMFGKMGTSYYGYQLAMADGGNAGKIRVEVNSSSGNQSTSFSASTYYDGLWHLAIATRPASGGNIICYVDGVSVGTVANSGYNCTGDGKLTVGNRTTDNSPFDGSLDDAFVMLNYTMTEAEVLKLYQGTSDGYVSII